MKDEDMTMKFRTLLLAGVILVPATFSAQSAQAGHDEPYCREYGNSIRVGGNIEAGYGKVCWQPDGSWKVVAASGGNDDRRHRDGDRDHDYDDDDDDYDDRDRGHHQGRRHYDSYAYGWPHYGYYPPVYYSPVRHFPPGHFRKHHGRHGHHRHGPDCGHRH